MTDNNALAQHLEYLIEHLAEAEGSRDADCGYVTGKAFQMMTMCPDPFGLAKAMNALPTILAALRTPAPASGEVGALAKRLREIPSEPQFWQSHPSRAACPGHPTAHEAADMLERLAGPVQEETDADNTPHAFVWAAPDTCRNCGNTKDHPVHQPVQQAGGDHVERVRNAISNVQVSFGLTVRMGQILETQELDALARAAIAAMPTPLDTKEG